MVVFITSTLPGLLWRADRSQAGSQARGGYLMSWLRGASVNLTSYRSGQISHGKRVPISLPEPLDSSTLIDNIQLWVDEMRIIYNPLTPSPPAPAELSPLSNLGIFSAGRADKLGQGIKKGNEKRSDKYIKQKNINPLDRTLTMCSIVSYKPVNRWFVN